MPRRLTHVVTSSFMGTAVALTRSKGQPEAARIYETLGGFCGGYAGGRVPDILDCARTPNHRNHAHSATVCAGLIKISGKVLDSTQDTLRGWSEELSRQEALLPVNSVQRAFLAIVAALCRILTGAIAGFISGYLTHLALDGMTPRSLQLV